MMVRVRGLFPWAWAKKNPRTDLIIDPRISQFYPYRISHNHLSTAVMHLKTFQAGLLTPGSFSLRAFPSFGQWHYAKIVPGYSGGPVPDFHRVPSYARLRST